MKYKALAQQLIDHYQLDFPLVSDPFTQIAQDLYCEEELIRTTLAKMLDDKIISRVGPIYQTHKVGFSILAACSCPIERLDEVASYINQFKEVNHNYERENAINLWFVVTGPDQVRVEEICTLIEQDCNVSVLRLPMVKPYKIDLSFQGPIQWGDK